MSMYASATCSTSHFLPQTAKRFHSVSFEAFRLQCSGCRNSVAFEYRVIPLEHVCFCYLFYITLSSQTAKRFDSVSFAAFPLQCPGCRNSVAFEFRVIHLEHVCFCYLFYITLSSANDETLSLGEFRGIPTSMPRLPKFSCLRISGDHS